MDSKCLKYDDCAESHPTLKAPGDRRGDYDFYYPSFCSRCSDYIPQTNVIERRTVYLENLTDGQFLRMQARLATLEDKLRPITKKKYNDYNI